MKCPQCGHENSKVVESREVGEGDSIRRRRECLECQHGFTTYERIELPNLAVVKKNGDRELFDRGKLYRAIHRSVGKFFNSDVEIEEMVARVEDELYAEGSQEISSNRIGDLILSELAKRNEVAYVRFASVYREFKSLSEFEEALKQFKKSDK